MFYRSTFRVFLTILLAASMAVGGTGSVPLQAFDSAKVLAQAEASEKPAAKERIGIVLSVKKKAFAIGADGKKRKLKGASPLFIGDRLETKKKSSLQVSFMDGSTLKLTANSDYTIKDYQFDEEKGIGVSKGGSDDGTLGFLAGKIAKVAPQNYKITTATATIGIRGSGGEFTTSSGPDASLLARTTEGHVLEVETDFGNFVLDDPNMGLSVTLTGVKMIPVEGSLVEAAEQAAEEEEDEEGGAGEEEEEEEEEEEAAEEESSEESAAEETTGETVETEAETEPVVVETSFDLGVDAAALAESVATQIADAEVPPDYTGQLLGFTSSNNPSFSSEVSVVKQDEEDIPLMVIAPSGDNKGTVDFNSRVLALPEFTTSFSEVIQQQSKDLDTQIEFNILHDDVGEFFIINEDSFGLSGDGNSTFSSIYFGVEQDDVPDTGISFYGTDISMIQGGNLQSSSIVVGSVVTRDTQILDIGAKPQTMVDFGQGKVFGTVEDLDRPLTMYYAELKQVDGSIRNVNVYGSYDYNTLNSLSINDDLLNDLTESGGHIYGSSSQGLGIYAESEDLSGHFISSGFKYSSNPTKVSSSDGDYVGYAQGMRIINSDTSLYQAVGATAPFSGVDPLTLSASFSGNSLSGTMFLGGHSLNVGGLNPNIAYDREMAFGELSSFSLPLEDHANYINAWALPEIVVDRVTGETKTPENVMWGNWNMVGKITSGNPDIYPALNNFWAAGKRKFGTLAGPLSYYEAASLNTVVHSEASTLAPNGSLGGLASFVLDRENNTFQALANIGNTYFVPVKGKITSINLGTMVADEWSVLSFYGDNEGVFSSALENSGTFQARLAGSDGGTNLLYEFQKTNNLSDIAYGVGLGVQSKTGSDLGLKDFRGFSSGMMLNSGQLIGDSGLILNFETPLLHSDLTWFDFGTSAPFVVPSFDSRSVLRLDANASPDPEQDQVVSFRTFGDFGRLSELTSLDYTFRSDSDIAPRITLLVDGQTPDAADISTNYSLTSTPRILEGLDQLGFNQGEWVSSVIDQGNGQTWLIDSADPTVPVIYVNVGGGSAQALSLFTYDGSPQAFLQTIEAWRNDPNIGAILAEGRIKGIEISFNSFDATPSLSAGETFKSNTAYIDRLELTSSSGASVVEEWDVDDPISNAVYISKDTFFVPEANRYLPLDALGSGVSADNSTSYIVSLPGLESFEYLSWGAWGTSTSGPDGNDRAFGFYAIGDYFERTKLTDREAWLANNPALANTVVSYTGNAIGAVFGTGRTGAIVGGSAQLNVNFNTGAVAGRITLPQDVIDLSAGSIDFLESFSKDSLIYHGGTIMNSAGFTGGSYRGQFFGTGSGADFAKESAGSFSGFDGQRRAVGAFGVKK